MAQDREFFSASKSKLKSLVFEIFSLKLYKSYVWEAWFLWEKKEKEQLWIACTEEIDTCARKGKEGLCGLRTSPKRAYMFRNTHAKAAHPIKLWRGETFHSLTETWIVMQKAHWQLMCASAGSVCPESGPAGRGQPLRLPREGEWLVPRDGWDCWTSPSGTGVSSLAPAVSSHWTRGWDFNHKELFLSVMGSTCKKGGSKDLSSSRWIATHLVNQLIKCNEYPALGKPRGPTVPYTVNFPHCPHLTLLCSGFALFLLCYLWSEY